MQTTRADVNEQITELEVLCRLAAITVRSYMPIGFGDDVKRERDTLCRQLAEIPVRFRRAMRAAQRKGWANR